MRNFIVFDCVLLVLRLALGLLCALAGVWSDGCLLGQLPGAWIAEYYAVGAPSSAFAGAVLALCRVDVEVSVRGENIDVE